MKRFVLAITLACALSASALAGEMHTTGAPSPNDPPLAGDMGNGGNQGTGNLDDDGNQGAGGIALLILDLLF